MKAHAGVALITAILVVAIASLAATAILTSSNLAIHRTAALRDNEQAWWMAQGVESWILTVIQADSNRNLDGLNPEDDPWALPVDYLPVDQGFVSGRILDEQGRFNLNNLDPALAGANAQAYEQQFLRLLDGLGATVPPGLVGAIRDWMDANQMPGFPGAEDSVYLGLDPPYRTADRPFTSVSELLAVQGVTPELYRALMTGCARSETQEQKQPEPCITALPKLTPVNVNTASHTLLRALDAQVDRAKLEAFIGERETQPAADVNSFIGKGIYSAAVQPAMLSVATQYFRVQGQVVVGSSRVALYSLIHRPQSGKPVVLAHSADAD